MDQGVSRKIIQLLIEQLQLGDRRSIHLNAFPGVSPKKLDLKSLGLAANGFEKQFLENILTSSKFSQDIVINTLVDDIDEDEEIFAEKPEIEPKKKKLSAAEVNSGKCIKRLNSIFYESVDEKQEFGVQTFAFGYPLAIKRLKSSPEKFIVSPIFLWYLDLDKSKTTIDKWVIRKNENLPIVMNKVLMSFVEKEDGIKLKPIADSYLEDGIIDRIEINELVNRFLDQIQQVGHSKFESSVESELQDLSERDVLNELCQQNGGVYVVNNGVFGCFRTMKETILDDLKGLLTMPGFISPEELEPDSYQSTSMSAVETDPSQQGVLNKLSNNNKILLEGPPGTGKSQTLTSIITNALASGSTCLVVCEKKTALEVIKNNLDKKRLFDLVAVIDDVYKDRNDVVDSVRARVENGMQYQSFRDSEYHALLNSFESKTKTVNGKHNLLDKEFHGGSRWTHLVGKYLKAKNASTEALDVDSALSSSLDFEYQEYTELLQSVEKYKYLQNKVINPDAFTYIKDEGITSLNDYDFKKLVLLASETERELIARIISLAEQTTTEFVTEITKDFTGLYVSSTKDIAKIISNLDILIQKFGDDFDMKNGSHNLKLKILGKIIKKYSIILEHKGLSLAAFDRLVQSISDEYYGIVIPKYSTFRTFTELRTYLVNLSNLIENWHKGLSETVENGSKELNWGSITKYSTVNSILLETKTSALELEQKVNAESSLLEMQLNLEGDKSRLSDLVSEIKLVKNDLLEVTNNADELLDYYELRRYYLSLTPAEKAFAKSSNNFISYESWKNAFNEWYFRTILEMKYSSDMPKDDYDIQYLKENESTLQDLQIDFIKNLWSIRQRNTATLHDKKSGKIETLYNKRGSKGTKRNSLRYIINSDFELFSSYFPVVLVNPISCSAIMPLVEGLFDVVIFDEASQLKLADTYTALMRGKYKVVSGDSQQMPPSSYFMSMVTSMDGDDDDEERDDEDIELEELKSNNQQEKDTALTLAESESLLEYAESQGYLKSYLDIHYRSKHPALINFSNAAFYGKRLLPFPPSKEYTPIEYLRVDGEYIDKTNPDEADKVIDILLTKIERRSDGNYPSVGVATFNLNQRNLINEKIYAILNDSSRPEDAKKLNELLGLEDPLFVKNLETIQGDERDIIIITTTFGLKMDGRFTQSYGPISLLKGHRLLNVIVTRAKEKLYICTSIPENKIATYRELIDATGVKSRGAFYSYLAYAKSVSSGNTEEMEEILDAVRSASSKEQRAWDNNVMDAESPFEEEVMEEIQREIGNERVTMQYKSGGFRIDIVVKPLNENKPLIAIECDGAKYHSSNEAAAWDVFRQKQLEKQGFKFHRIWSTNWFHDNHREVKKLLDFIKVNE